MSSCSVKYKKNYLAVKNLSETLEKRRSFIINFVYYTILIALFCLVLRYAFTPMLPLIIAAFLAIVLQKPVNKIVAKTKIPKGIVAAITVLLVMAIFGGIVYLLGGRLIAELRSFIDFVRLKIEDYSWIETQVYSVVNALPTFLKDSVTPTVNEFLEKLKPAMESDAASGVYKISFATIDFPNILKNYFSGILDTAKQIPSVLVAMLVCVVGACFMTTEYDIFSNAIRRYAPGGENNLISATKRVLMTSVGKLFKAYFLIMCITFLELLAGLYLFKLIGIFDSNYMVAIALLSAMFDILPIVGIGTILWPWAIFSIVTGNVGLGIGLILLYIFVTVIRQIIEPKFVAGQMHMPAALTLSVMYIGLKTFGVIGMFAFTIALYCIKALDTEGVIHIFGDSDKEESVPEAVGETVALPEPVPEQATES